jgi:glycosyltransferase involved in cell wall biosynthesis
VVVVGRLEHAELVDLLPACEAQVVPSTFPEAFGMVAAEAAACGVLPVSAGHSGLAEVTAQLREVVPAEAAAWLSFDVGPDAVRELADDLVGWLEAGEGLRATTRRGARGHRAGAVLVGGGSPRRHLGRPRGPWNICHHPSPRPYRVPAPWG